MKSGKNKILSLVLLSACANANNHAEEQIATPFSAAKTHLGKFRNTWYCLALEADYSGARTDRILDKDGNLLAVISPRFERDLRIEGSGKLNDSRVLNFAAMVNGEHRYRFTENPFGDGVGTCALVPFHTIAVDPRRIPLGSVVRIKETVGMKLPDGTLHNGIWRAEDIGVAIKGDRIDLFVGAGEGNGRVIDQQGIDNLQALTVDLIQEPQEGNCTTQTPLPSVP